MGRGIEGLETEQPHQMSTDERKKKKKGICVGFFWRVAMQRRRRAPFPFPFSHPPGAGGRAMQASSGISKRVDVITTTDFWKEKKRQERTTMFCVFEASELQGPNRARVDST